MNIGFALPSVTPGTAPRNLTFTEVREWAARAEAAGFDSIWVPDHFFVDMGNSRRGTLDCWTLMTALVMATSRARIGSLVLCNAFRNPGLLAKSAATLNHISGGRFVLGMGAGWHQPEYDSLGLPFDHRVSRLEESLKVLGPLLAGEKVSFEGRFVQLQDAEIVPALVTEPRTPLWVAAVQERMLRLTAELADGWNTAWHGRDTVRFRRQAQVIRDRATELGRPVSALTVSVNLLPGSNEKNAIGGDADAIAAAFKDYADAGAEEVVISFSMRPFAIDEARYFDEFAEQALPLAKQI